MMAKKIKEEIENIKKIVRDLDPEKGFTKKSLGTAELR